MNRRAFLTRQKSTASFMVPGETPKRFSGVACRLNAIFEGTGGVCIFHIRKMPNFPSQ